MKVQINANTKESYDHQAANKTTIMDYQFIIKNVVEYSIPCLLQIHM